MEIKWLKTFLVAAKYENLRKASEELYITQPGVTKHIKRLENYLCIELFERKGKSITLTLEGQKFLGHAKAMIFHYEQEMSMFNSWEQGFHSELTIAVAPQIASSILPLFLRKFIHENPTIEVNVQIINSFDVGREVYSGRADIGLTRIESIQDGVTCEVLHRDPVVMVAPPLEQLTEQRALQNYRVVTNNHPVYWDELMSELKRHYPDVKMFPVTQIEITKKFLEEGLGVSYLPLSMVKEELIEKKLVEIPLEKIKRKESLTYLVTKFETKEILVWKNSFQEFLAHETFNLK